MMSGRHAYRQAGQALAEGLLATAVLGIAWVAIVWVGQLQDIAVQAGHAGRAVAFLAVRDPSADTGLVRRAYFEAPHARWRDHAGKRLLPEANDPVVLRLQPLPPLADEAQPGQHQPNAVALRQQWGLADRGILQASVRVGLALPWARLASGQVTVRRQIAILRDAGHSPDALAAQDRVARSDSAWRQAQRTSQSLGQAVQTVMQQVDAGWRRPPPSFDWLRPWADRVPALTTTETRQGSHDAD